MKKTNRYFLILFSVLIFASCKKAYNPPVLQAANNYLVVDGFISINANDTTTITLSRTRNLTDTVLSSPEYNARISIESSTGSSFLLTDNTHTGNYRSASLNLSAANKYRLKIITSDNHQYLSDYVATQSGSPIDSITWEQDKDVTIYVNSHDPANKTHYYKWDFVETWEHHARIENYWGEANGHIFFLDPTTQMFKCWSSANSTNIVTGTSIALSEDVISHIPVTTIPKDDEKIKVRYSIDVRQIPLSLEAYNYWVIIQKNSQQLGTLFDLQPSQISGNIHSISNPDEPAIGFVSAVSTTKKRIFISNADLTDWSTLITGRECNTMAIPANFPDAYSYTYPDPEYAPFFFSGSGPAFLIIIRKECIDCRLNGGSNQMPSFW